MPGLAVDAQARRPLGRRFLVVAVVIALMAITAVGAWAVGYRLNIKTADVAIPAPGAGPEVVVRSYVSAYNHRDFATMATLYPTHSAPKGIQRYVAIGTMSDFTIIDSHRDTSYGKHSPYWAVQVELNYTDMQGADFGYLPGHNGWTYYLQRIGPDHAWRIIDHGVG